LPEYQFKKPLELDDDCKQCQASGGWKGSLPFEPVRAWLDSEPAGNGVNYFLGMCDRDGTQNKIPISEIVFVQGDVSLEQCHIHFSFR
jgi:hypothetical protein